MVNKGEGCFTLSRLTGSEYGISIGNGLNCGVNWHIIERGKKRFENKYTFQHYSKYEDTGPIASCPLPVYLISVCTKVLSCFCTWERVAALGKVSGRTWNLLLRSASQQAYACRGASEEQRRAFTALVFQGLLLSQNNKQNASEFRIFYIFLDYWFFSQFSPLNPPNPSSYNFFFHILFNVRKRLVIYLQIIYFFDGHMYINYIYIYSMVRQTS